MTWRDDLREGSFRGVPFYCESAESIIGRRTVVHRYPGRDDADVEDMGRKAAEFTFKAFVIGDDYMAARDALIDAFEEPGAGELIHPYWGQRRVALNGDVSITETTADGGMAQLTIPVIESGIRVVSAATTIDTATKVDTAATKAVEAAADAFGDAYDVADIIESAIDNAREAVAEVFSTVRSIKGSINAALNLVDEGLTAIDNAAELIDDIASIPGDLVDLVNNTIADIMGSISTIENSVADLMALGQDEELPYSEGATSQRFRSQILMAAWRVAYAFDADGAVVYGSGTQATQEAANLAAIIDSVKLAATIETARALSVITFDSFDRAFATLEEIGNALEELAQGSSDDVVYMTLIDLRSALALHIQSTAADLPRVVHYTPADTTPALVMAQELYGDATMADDIIERNLVRNPCAVAGGVEIEVLSND